MKSITLLAFALAALALTGCETSSNGTSPALTFTWPIDLINRTQPVQVPPETQRVVTASEVTVQPAQVVTYPRPLYEQPSTLTYRPQPGLEK